MVASDGRYRDRLRRGSDAGRDRALAGLAGAAANTFDAPERVTLSELARQLRGDSVHATLPRHTVAALELEVA